MNVNIQEYKCDFCQDTFQHENDIEVHLRGGHDKSNDLEKEHRYSRTSSWEQNDIERFESQIKQNDVEELKKTLSQVPNWTDLEFQKTIDVSAWIKQQQECKIDLTDLNILHLAIIEHQIESVHAIMAAAQEKGGSFLSTFFKEKINATVAKN